MKHLVSFIMIVWWFCGVALAPTLWYGVGAFVFPPYGMILVIQRIFEHYKI